jgi:16S rRNA (uracil1498-N3)-methyltransferase
VTQSDFDVRRRATSQVLVADIESCIVDDDDLHHVLTVMRARDGEHVVATDGNGSWRMLTVDGGALVPSDHFGSTSRPTPTLVLVVSPLKGDRTEMIVQKATELGVDRLVVAPMDHTVAKLRDDKIAVQRERWQKIADAALAQSRGLWRTHVDVVASLEDAAANAAGDVWRADFADDAVAVDSMLDGSVRAGCGEVAVLIGPEGGFSASERERFPSVVSLGPGVLRAETAALSAAVQLTVARDRLAR